MSDKRKLPLLSLLAAAMTCAAQPENPLIERQAYENSSWTAAVAPAQPGVSHDKAYRQAVVANDFTPPADAPLPGLLRELNGYLASPDPELRDGSAYAVLTQWIYVKRLVPADLLRPLAAEWRANLARGMPSSPSLPGPMRT